MNINMFGCLRAARRVSVSRLFSATINVARLTRVITAETMDSGILSSFRGCFSALDVASLAMLLKAIGNVSGNAS